MSLSQRETQPSLWDFVCLTPRPGIEMPGYYHKSLRDGEECTLSFYGETANRSSLFSSAINMPCSLYGDCQK